MKQTDNLNKNIMEKMENSSFTSAVKDMDNTQRMLLFMSVISASGVDTEDAHDICTDHAA